MKWTEVLVLFIAYAIGVVVGRTTTSYKLFEAQQHEMKARDLLRRADELKEALRELMNEKQQK